MKNSIIIRYGMKLCLVAIALFVLGVTTGYSQGFNYPVGNPTGTSGTGNARTDPDNLFIRNNIAGMTEIPVNEEEENSGQLGDSGSGKWRLNGEIQGSIYKYKRERVLPGPTQGITSRATILNPGFAGEITYTSGDHRFAFGAGAYQAFGFQSKFEDPISKLGPRAQFFDGRVASNDVAFGGAVRLHKTLSVGGGFIFGRGFVNIKIPTAALAFFGVNETSFLDVDDIGAPGATVGVHFRPTQRISFGLNYKSKRKYQMEGDLKTFAVAFIGGQAQFLRVQPDVRVKFELPTVAEGGVAVNVTKKLMVAFDFRFYDYTATFQSLDLLAKTTRQPIMSVRIDGEDVRSVRFGGVYSLSDSTKIHFGTAFTANGIPDANIQPALVNVGGLDISGGIGKKIFGRWLNIGAAGIFGRERSIGPPANRLFPGEYNGRGFLIGIGMRM
ncbi:MAG: outer membrane protein transport protein [Acidobacteriota bacterium]